MTPSAGRHGRSVRRNPLGALALLLSALIVGSLPSAPALAVTIDWVTVGLPGNACEVQSQGCFGGVDYTYRISKYEVTNAQYAEFLNGVAASDPNGLYNPQMTSSPRGGITRSGGDGSYVYTAIAGRDQMPVVFVSFYDALRFANWMDNGQIVGFQDATTTEDGTYTITEQGILDNTIVRNAGPRIAIPSEDEWYKAAYHDALGMQSTDYFRYPAGSSTIVTCDFPSNAPNSANCGPTVNDFTDVGSYTASSSPWGTFDQGGNSYNWNEAVDENGFNRQARGGSWADGHIALASTTRRFNNPLDENEITGFRLVAPIPEPSTGLLVALGLLGLARRRRAR